MIIFVLNSLFYFSVSFENCIEEIEMFQVCRICPKKAFNVLWYSIPFDFPIPQVHDLFLIFNFGYSLSLVFDS
jgi:hypothetical protein